MSAIFSLVERVREEQPLVFNITNVVVANFVANGMLALGASPVMAYDRREVSDMARMSNAVILNIGTLTEETVEAMIIAGKAANEKGIPVIFDPVCYGATPYRIEASERILQEVKVDILRGNAGEISQIAGADAVMKGVDAGEVSGNMIDLVQQVAKKHRTIVIATGKIDYLSDGNRLYQVENGHPYLPKVTGSGCLLSSTIGAFAAVEKDYLKASLAASSFYGAAAEQAAQKAGHHGPGSFQYEFLNALSVLGHEEWQQLAKYKEVSE